MIWTDLPELQGFEDMAGKGDRKETVCSWMICKLKNLRMLSCLLYDWHCVAIIGQENPKLNFVEFFAGDAQACKMFKRHGFSTARLDIAYMGRYRGSYEHQNPMDLTTAAGMGNLGYSYTGHRTLFYFYRFQLVMSMYHGGFFSIAWGFTMLGTNMMYENCSI